MRCFALLALIPLGTFGCSQGLDHFATAKVTGKVLCEGKPVPHVRVYFVPFSDKGAKEIGKQGLGNAKEDGTFSVFTYGEDDGAVVGKHNIRVSTPHPEDFPTFKCNCETNGSNDLMEVEVKADGKNEFVVELPPKKNKNAPNIDPETLKDIKASSESANGSAKTALK